MGESGETLEAVPRFGQDQIMVNADKSHAVAQGQILTRGCGIESAIADSARYLGLGLIDRERKHDGPYPDRCITENEFFSAAASKSA